MTLMRRALCILVAVQGACALLPRCALRAEPRSLRGEPRSPRAEPRSLRRSAPEDAEAEAEASPAKKVPSYKQEGRYDVSKLVGGQMDEEGKGFNQFDPVLSATQGLSRRFGLVGGLSVVGLLLFVEGGSIVDGFFKAEPVAGANTKVELPSGLAYSESLIGRAGDSPIMGAVIGLKARVSVGDKVIFDTKDDKPVAFKYGQRPYQNVICAGVEEGILGMKAGGKRRLVVPADLAPEGVAKTLPDGVPLIYDIELTEVLPGYF